MITLQELRSYLNNFLQVNLFSDLCPNGLQVEGRPEISKLATAVSASLATIEAAVEAKIDALIVHHGLFWNKDSYVIEGVKQKKLKLLLENGISLFAYHAPLDAHRECGNNWKAAVELGWRDLEPFGLYNGLHIGVKGSFDLCSRAAFMKQLEAYYDHPALAAMGGKEEVQTAALISGGAYRSISEAATAGVDCFITGNHDEPAWHDAMEKKINFFALGHSNTERIGPRSLGHHLQKQLGIPCQFLDLPNPF